MKKKEKKLKVGDIVPQSIACPFCKSEDIDSLEEDYNSDSMSKTWHCGNCRAAWVETFVYDNTEIVSGPER